MPLLSATRLTVECMNRQAVTGRLPGAWHLKLSKTVASSVPRAWTRQPDGRHYRGGITTAVLICDIGPTVLYPRPALAQ